MTNLLETSMDSPSTSPIGPAIFPSDQEKKTETQKLDFVLQKLAKPKEGIDWSSLTGWRGETVPKSPKLIPELVKQQSLTSIPNRQVLVIDKADGNSRVKLKHRDELGERASSASKYSMLRTPMPSMRNSQQGLRNAFVSSEKRNSRPILQPTNLDLADFVRTNLGFTPNQTSRFEDRAKASLTRNPRRSIGSEASFKTDTKPFESNMRTEEKSISNRPVLKGLRKDHREVYFNTNLQTKRRTAVDWKENKSKPSYLERKRLLKDTKKVLSDFSRLRVMNLIASTAAAGHNVSVTNNQVTEAKHLRFSVHLRQGSGLGSRMSQREQPTSVQELQETSIHPSAGYESMTMRTWEASDSPWRGMPSSFVLGNTTPNERTDTGEQAQTKTGLLHGLDRMSLIALSPHEVQNVLRRHLANTNHRRLQAGTHVGTLIKSHQIPNGHTDQIPAEQELSLKQKKTLQSWKNSFEKEKPNSNLPKSGYSLDDVVDNASQGFKRRSDIEGLMWQLESLGKKLSKKENQPNNSKAISSKTAQQNPGIVAKPVEHVTLERTVLTPFQKGTGVERNRHIRSVSMGFVSAPKSQPVVSIRNSSGRLLGRYQLKKTLVPN